MSEVARRQIKRVPAYDLLSPSLSFDSLIAATLHCCHLRLIPLKDERGVKLQQTNSTLQSCGVHGYHMACVCVCVCTEMQT